MKTHRPRSNDDSKEGNLDYQHFKIRLQVSAHRIKKQAKASAMPELLGKIGQWCQVSTSSQQIQRFVELYENRNQRSGLKTSRPGTESMNDIIESLDPEDFKQSLRAFLRVLITWFVEEKPELYRVKPVSEITDSRYFLILYTYIQDYKLLNLVMADYGHYEGEIDGLLNEYIQRHLSTYHRVKNLGTRKVKNLKAVKKEIETAIKHINEMKKLDTQSRYKEKLEEALFFYNTQLRLLTHRSSIWDKDIDEKSSNFIVSLLQKKLVNRLIRKKDSSRLQYYRENLLKLYLELTNYTPESQTKTDMTEVEILEKIREVKDSQDDLKYHRTCLINLWRKTYQELQEIINSFTDARENKRTQDKWQTFTELFDGVFEQVISRLNLATPNANGSEFIKLHALVRKYINFKEKRFLVPMTQIKDYFVNVVQNIIWDYQELSNVSSTKQLIGKYEKLLNLIQEQPFDIKDFEKDLFFNLQYCKLYIEKTDEDTDILYKFEKLKGEIIESSPEDEYLTIIIVNFLDFKNDAFLKCLETIAKKYPGRFESAIAKYKNPGENKPETVENMTITFVNYNETSFEIKQAFPYHMTEYCDTKEPPTQIDYGFTQVAQVHNIFGICPSSKEKVYDSESIQAISDIFKFYSSQKCEKSEEKPGLYLNLEQFYMFAKDFSLKIHPGLLRQAFLGNSRLKPSINEIQFYSVIEDLSEKLHQEASSKDNTRAFLKSIGCFDFSYKNWFVGSSSIEQSEIFTFKPAPRLLKKSCLDSPMTPIKHLKSIKTPATPKVINPTGSKVLLRYRTSLNSGLKKAKY